LTPDLSIIVPTYNERDRLPELVRTILVAFEAAGISGELVVVDDNSPDGTGRVADELAASAPVRVIHRAGKLGLGTAVVEGFNAATAAVVGVADADLSHPPELIPRMLAVMRKTRADVVIGSRYIPGGGTKNWGAGRLLMSRFACLLARLVTPVRDATSGFFLIRRDLARSVKISAGGFKICLELLIRSEPGLVVEVPYVFVGRTAGESKMNYQEATGYLDQLRDLRRFEREHHSRTPRHVILSETDLREAVSGL
jgi:dolichol-phosphate mannosyltransferase